MLLINLALNFLNMLKVKSLECMSVVNQKCMPGPKILDINPNESLYYPSSVKLNKCSSSCNDINHPFAKLCIPDVTKNVNIELYNLLAQVNETRHMLWHETCKCVCRLSSTVCNNKQIWNKNTCTCECNDDFVDKINCKEGNMWSPSTCSCECDLWCKQGKYLDHKNYGCKNRLIGKVTELCSSFINAKMVDVDENGVVIYEKDQGHNVYVALFCVALLIGVIAGGVFVYRQWFQDKKCFNGIFTKKTQDKNSSDVSEVYGNY